MRQIESIKKTKTFELIISYWKSDNFSYYTSLIVHDISLYKIYLKLINITLNVGIFIECQIMFDK